MKHEEYEHEITLYLLGDLDPERAAFIKQLLEESEECRALAQDHELTLGLLRDALADSPEVPGVLDDAHRDAVLQSEEPEVAVTETTPKKKGLILRIKQYPRVAANIAALFVAAFMSIGVMQMIQNDPEMAASRPTSSNDYFNYELESDAVARIDDDQRIEAGVVETAPGNTESTANYALTDIEDGAEKGKALFGTDMKQVPPKPAAPQSAPSPDDRLSRGEVTWTEAKPAGSLPPAPQAAPAPAAEPVHELEAPVLPAKKAAAAKKPAAAPADDRNDLALPVTESKKRLDKVTVVDEAVIPSLGDTPVAGSLFRNEDRSGGIRTKDLSSLQPRENRPFSSTLEDKKAHLNAPTSPAVVTAPPVNASLSNLTAAKELPDATGADPLSRLAPSKPGKKSGKAKNGQGLDRKSPNLEQKRVANEAALGLSLKNEPMNESIALLPEPSDPSAAAPAPSNRSRPAVTARPMPAVPAARTVTKFSDRLEQVEREKGITPLGADEAKTIELDIETKEGEEDHRGGNKLQDSKPASKKSKLNRTFRMGKEKDWGDRGEAEEESKRMPAPAQPARNSRSGESNEAAGKPLGRSNARASAAFDVGGHAPTDIGRAAAIKKAADVTYEADGAVRIEKLVEESEPGRLDRYSGTRKAKVGKESQKDSLRKQREIVDGPVPSQDGERHAWWRGEIAAPNSTRRDRLEIEAHRSGFDPASDHEQLGNFASKEEGADGFGIRETAGAFGTTWEKSAESADASGAVVLNQQKLAELNERDLQAAEVDMISREKRLAALEDLNGDDQLEATIPLYLKGGTQDHRKELGEVRAKQSVERSLGAMKQELRADVEGAKTKHDTFASEPMKKAHAAAASAAPIASDAPVEIEKLLQEGRTAYNNGEMNKATELFEGVLVEDKYNRESMRHLAKIAGEKGSSDHKSREVTTEEMMAQVKDRWNVEPKEEHEERAGGEALKERLRNIVVPELDFDGATASEVVDFMVKTSREQDAKGNGLNIVLLGELGEQTEGEGLKKMEDDFDATDAGGEADGKAAGDITMSLRNVTMLDAIRFVSEISGIEARFEDDVVVLEKAGRVASDPTEFYPVDRVLLSTLANLQPTAGGVPELSDAALQATDWKRVFSIYGVPIPGGTAIVYSPEISKLVVTGAPETQEKLKQVVSKFEAGESPDPEQASVYKAYSFNPYVETASNPFSTFAIDVDNAAYTLTRSHMKRGTLPPPDAVRTEEFVNFFNYHYPSPDNGVFAVYNEAAPSPFGSGYLLKVGVKGKVIGRDQQRPANLTFVIDTSGSMDTPDRLGLAKKSLKLLIAHLGENDRVAIVQYDFKARLVLDHTPATDKKTITEALDRLQISGSTNLEDGIKLGYALAAKAFDPLGVNQVLLISDGMANLGDANAENILKEVEAHRKQGITCSIFGFGVGNYNDVMLETLANKGNGVYRFIDRMDEAKRVFVDNLSSTLNYIASDVKIQVQFNPERVTQYRQIGYENRQLKAEQFRDDTVDAGEVGSGQAVTALYELDIVGDPRQPIGTARVRYRNLDTNEIEEIEREITVSDLVRDYDQASGRFKLAACVAEFAEILRGSPFSEGTSYAAVADQLRPVSQEYNLDQHIQELLRLVQSANGMPRSSK